MPNTRNATLATFALLGGFASSAAHAGSYPVLPNFATGFAAALANAQTVPAGANLLPCHSGVDPYPVVLVNGTFTVMIDSFGAMAPDLANAGYCVYTFNYGGASAGDPIQATGPVAASAQQLATFVAQVKAATGAAKVDLVGYSQGGLLVEYYTKLLGGAANVHAVVNIGPTTHGTTLDGLAILGKFLGINQPLASFCQACVDQETGSAVVNAVDAGPIAQPGIPYTIIDTIYETVVTPVGSSFINQSGVKNEYVQSFCPFDAVDHVDLPWDNVVIQLVKNALAPSTARSPNCLIEFPFAAL
jgi:pimeloyl-ACP methyl ester carboxylesterase